MKCQSCEQVLADDAQFCGSCGMSTASHPSNAETRVDVQEVTNDAGDRPFTDEQYAPRHDPRLGLILDSKYKLIESLGQGGMGSVFRAQRLHIGDEVAVKLLHRDLVREQKALERFRREARTAAMIRHPNVVSIHDFNDGTSEASEAYIVMELVRGRSLGDLLRREGRMSSPRAVRLMHDICAGVGVAHRQGLLHRDLKPDNVIVVPPSHEDEEETAKVVDFGLAKVRDVTAATALTHTGAVIGTLYYMSPEQCSGDELDARADVYSLGAMFYEMLTGGPPFRSNNFAGLISKHLHEPPPPFPRELQIPPALEAVCLRALAKDRHQRQSDAIGFGRELENALTAPAGFQPGPIPGAKRENPWRWLLVSVGVLFALLVVIAAGFGVKFAIDMLRIPDANVTDRNNNQSTPAVIEPGLIATAVDLTGTWTGSYGPLGYATKLIITSHSGDKVEGTLEQRAIRVAFNGTYDSEKRELTMKQTKVLSGEGWSLGEDTGTLSDDGKSISGTGKDELGGTLGMTYQWSFKRR